MIFDFVKVSITPEEGREVEEKYRREEKIHF